ncbi:MAG: MFS transporter [Gemmatimonadales bacterium]|nr:MAG: MFS transporter [Gemmatimonadales bacterium]
MTAYLRFIRGEIPLLSYGLSFTFLSSFGQTFLLSLFVPAFLIEFAISNGEFGALYAGATLASALLLPWAGSWMDRIRLNRFTLVVVLVLAGSAFLLAVSWSLWVFAIALLGLRLAGQGLSGQTALTAMARYFGPGRGKALSITSLGFPLGEGVLPLLIAASIGVVGWRMSWGVVGGMVLMVFAPALVLLLRHAGVELDPARASPKDGGHSSEEGAAGDHDPEGANDPEEVGGPSARDPAKADSGSPRREGASGSDAGATRPNASGAPELPDPSPMRQGWNRREVLGDPRFWFVLPAALLPPFWVTGFFLYQTAIAGIKGWSLPLMASAFVAFAITRVVLSLLAGGWIDRFSARRVFPFSPLPLALGCAILWQFDAAWAAWGFMASLGVAVGISGTVKPALWAELYGVRHLGAIQTMMAALMVLSTAGSPVLIGFALDAGVALEHLLLAGIVSVGVGTLLSFRLYWPSPATAAG